VQSTRNREKRNGPPVRGEDFQSFVGLARKSSAALDLKPELSVREEDADPKTVPGKVAISATLVIVGAEKYCAVTAGGWDGSDVRGPRKYDGKVEGPRPNGTR
jgi:hypothetical protein